jgi:hypothetical protein
LWITFKNILICFSSFSLTDLFKSADKQEDFFTRMGCYRPATIVVLVLAVFFASSNIYKLFSSSSDENIKQFLCQHHKHDPHKDMLDRQQRRHQKQVLSHTIEEEKESFGEKIKHDMDKREKDDVKLREILKENRCRKKITKSQMEGMHILAKIGMVVSFLSLASSLIAFLPLLNDSLIKNARFRYALIPYICVHLCIIPFDVFASVFTLQLVHKLSAIHVAMVIFSTIVIIMFTFIASMYYRLLSQTTTAVTGNTTAKEEFDYSIMPEEKDASEAWNILDTTFVFGFDAELGR